MTQRYAAKTTVTVEKSKTEIEAVLRRYGADQFMYAWQTGMPTMGFRMGGLPIRMILPLPTEEQFRFTQRNRVTPQEQKAAYEQAERQLWRAFLLVIKAKLEAVEAGIITIEDEFLANIVLQDNSTIKDNLLPRLQESIASGRFPLMLPEPREIR